MQIWCRKLANLSNSPRHAVYSKTSYDCKHQPWMQEAGFFAPLIQIFLIQKLFIKDKHIVLYPLQFFHIPVFSIAVRLLCLKKKKKKKLSGTSHCLYCTQEKNVRVMKFSWSESIWYTLGANNSKPSINTWLLTIQLFMTILKFMLKNQDKLPKISTRWLRWLKCDSISLFWFFWGFF